MNDLTSSDAPAPSGGGSRRGDNPQPGSDLTRYLPSRSIGLKLLLVCILALAMAIPAGFVWALVYERSANAERAVDEVSETRGGHQMVMGPVLIVPLERTFIEKVQVSETGRMADKSVTRRSRFVIFAETGEASATASTEILKRGIHDVPVFETSVSLNADFDLQTALRDVPRNGIGLVAQNHKRVGSR